eukprot:CAMPEP_0204375638 /NCGR_PEP_ID=MMETSP0469-20131031/49404_1 /ASSEMBLY_ACC=CAM_ASM_000384 /TAXON_ID=2969 /ORGANISM="Oxyrrhis marina" /LENGTH=147 /DNA_ID=CAMNT_0051366361 /DNA_START=18 /DNA_END=461 /DNA_ORIENTATION=-
MINCGIRHVSDHGLLDPSERIRVASEEDQLRWNSTVPFDVYYTKTDAEHDFWILRAWYDFSPWNEFPHLLQWHSVGELLTLVTTTNFFDVSVGMLRYVVSLARHVLPLVRSQVLELLPLAPVAGCRAVEEDAVATLNSAAAHVRSQL